MKLNFSDPLSFCQQIHDIYSSDLLVACHRSNLGVALKYHFQVISNSRVNWLILLILFNLF